MCILPVCKSLFLCRTSWDPSAELKQRCSFQAEHFPKCFREAKQTMVFTSTISAAVCPRCGFEHVCGISVPPYVPCLIDPTVSEQMNAPAQLLFYEEHVEITKVCSVRNGNVLNNVVFPGCLGSRKNVRSLSHSFYCSCRSSESCCIPVCHPTEVRSRGRHVLVEQAEAWIQAAKYAVKTNWFVALGLHKKHH